ncbi:MAG: hypothetical protein PVF56_03235 [Desulfobacterales bacterium]
MAQLENKLQAKLEEPLRFEMLLTGSTARLKSPSAVSANSSILIARHFSKLK